MNRHQNRMAATEGLLQGILVIGSVLVLVSVAYSELTQPQDSQITDNQPKQTFPHKPQP